MKNFTHILQATNDLLFTISDRYVIKDILDAHASD